MCLKDLLARNKRLELICLYGSAMLTALILVIPQLGLLQWISMIPMLWAIFLRSENSARRLRWHYGYGFLVIFAYYFVIYHWFVAMYPLEFAGISPASAVVVILAGWLGLSLLQALPGGLFFVGFALLNRTGAFKRYPILKPIAFAAVWVVFEWSSTLAWTGVPWGRLVLGQNELLPVLQISSLLGSYAVSFLLVLVNGLLAYCLLYGGRRLACGAVAAGLFFGNLALGLVLMHRDYSGETVRVAVIQGNISSHEKWESSSYIKMMQVYGDYTRAAAEEGAGLIVWPETTITTGLTTSRTMRDFVTELAAECNVTILVGALCYEEGLEYNSLFMVTADGGIAEDRYDKRHLVPFGEYVPMRQLITTLIPPLAQLTIIESDFIPGADSALFSTPWGDIGSLICFDSIYETLTIDSVRDGAELMVISSNDSWFLDSAAIYQHQAQARLRTIECGKYMLRAANTGISTVMKPNGELMAWIAPLEDGYAVCDVVFREERTLYSVIGNLFVFSCLAFCCAIPLTEQVKKRLSYKKSEYAAMEEPQE